MSEELKPLSKKDLATLAKYFEMWNGTRAWMHTHPKCSYNAARANASEWLAKPNIKAAIEEKLSELQMSADEALKLQTDIARGDMGEFLDVNGIGFNLDLHDAKSRGLTKLIKKVKQRTTTFIAKKESEEDREVHELEIELYPADIAQERILKMHGRLKDELKVKVYNVSLTDDDE